MQFKSGDIFHYACNLLFIRVLPNGVAGIGIFQSIADYENMISAIAFETEIFQVSLLIGHNERFDTISLLKQLQQHVEAFYINVERAVGHHIHHRRQIHVVTLYRCLEIVKLTLGRIVTVITQNTAHRHTYLVRLRKVERTTGVGYCCTRRSHHINKIEVVALIDRRPVNGILFFRHQDTKWRCRLC